MTAAARRPSSVWVGGIRMSVTTTSGRCSRTCVEELLARRCLADHGEASVLEHAHDTGPQQERVLGHDDAEGRSAARSRAGQLCSQPRALARRARDLERAAERGDAVGEASESGAVAALAPPTPSSLTSTSSCPSTRSTRTVACSACAYFDTLVSASETDEVRGGLHRRGQATGGPPTMSTGTGARAASARTAGSSPRSERTAGWMPRARSRSSFEALPELVDARRRAAPPCRSPRSRSCARGAGSAPGRRAATGRRHGGRARAGGARRRPPGPGGRARRGARRGARAARRRGAGSPASARWRRRRRGRSRRPARDRARWRPRAAP